MSPATGQTRGCIPNVALGSTSCFALALELGHLLWPHCEPMGATSWHPHVQGGPATSPLYFTESLGQGCFVTHPRNALFSARRVSEGVMTTDQYAGWRVASVWK